MGLFRSCQLQYLNWQNNTTSSEIIKTIIGLTETHHEKVGNKYPPPSVTTTLGPSSCRPVGFHVMLLSLCIATSFV